MITGFNTDIEHGGVVYHVQTEDKGLDSPLILSLVYSGGTILASKRSPYDDLIAAGYSEKSLAERLQRQHKLICAAIRAGRIEELKLMTQREAVARSAQRQGRPTEQPVIESTAHGGAAQPSQHMSPAELPPTAVPVMPPTAPAAMPPAATMSESPVVISPAGGPQLEPPGQIAAEHGLRLALLDNTDFHGGDVVALRIRVSREHGGRQGASVAHTPVTVKILGTTFRPLICTAMTDRDGLAVVFTTLPRFTTGRAALLIRAIVGSQEAELRRIILPG